MLIDTHLHESKYSGDSFITLEEIVYRSMEMGLHGVCITDHESNKIKKEAEVLMKETGFLIITGAEILTFEGDMTVFGLERLPGKRIHAQELTDIVDKAGGVAVCSHPYRQNNRDGRSYKAVESTVGYRSPKRKHTVAPQQQGL